MREVIGAVFTIIVCVWGFGAFRAHEDVKKGCPVGIILRRMYGTEYNVLTRHGYRMYIKHFTTMDPKNVSGEELGRRIGDVLKETTEDLGRHFSGKDDTDEARALYLLRERAADAAGAAATRFR